MAKPRRDEIYQRLSRYISRHHDPGPGREAYDFNIKIRKLDIPDSVRASMSAREIDEIFENESEDRLRSFADDLLWGFPWMEGWGQTGRSGGWLTVTTQEPVLDEGPEWPSPESLKAARKRLADLDSIRTVVNNAVSEFERELETEAFWGLEPEEWRPRE